MEAAPAHPWRLRGLRTVVVGDLEVQVADSRRARLIGLAGLKAIPPRAGLLLPRCWSVHTFGMRFALDLVWLDGDGTIIRIDEAVPPRRVRTCRRARAVVELAAGDARRAGLAGQ